MAKKAPAKKAAVKPKRTNVSNEAFIMACAESKYASEVAEKLDLSVAAVTTRVAKFRKNGVPIEFERKKQEIDYDAMKALYLKKKKK